MTDHAAASFPPSSASHGSPPANLWARQTGAANERSTNRLRRIVDGLPSWEPLPPGELPVARRGTGS